MSMSRQLRRAAERRAAKEARKAAIRDQQLLTPPAPEQFESQNWQPVDLLSIQTDPPLPSDHDYEEEITPDPRAHGKGGPRTAAGKAKSSLNNLHHGLTGSFRILPHEQQSDFDQIRDAFDQEHQPGTPTEDLLVEKMSQHVFLSRRAQRLQDDALVADDLPRFSLFLRYQTTNDRAFFKSLTELRKLQKERQKAANQFVSQKVIDARTRLNNAKAHHLEVDAAIRENLDIPTENPLAIPYGQAKELFTRCLVDVALGKGVRATA